MPHIRPPMMAMLAVPLIGSAGVAIDVTQANATRAALQNALDATALAISRNAATMNAADLQSTGSDDHIMSFRGGAKRRTRNPAAESERHLRRYQRRQRNGWPLARAQRASQKLNEALRRDPGNKLVMSNIRLLQESAGRAKAIE